MVFSKRFLLLKICVAVALIGSLGVSGSAAENDIVISQKNRRFNPASVDLPKDGALVIVNDDGDLLHHAYVESSTFSFDSGDQKPGSRTQVVFPVSGMFMVLCGIHPKMKLAVHVH